MKTTRTIKTITIHRHYYNIQALYKKANTKTQRALIGYMIYGGLAADPIYGGAFTLLREIESHVGVYNLETMENAETTMEIISIVEDAMLGLWDDLAFTEREINTILMQLGHLEGKGVKGK